MNTSIKMVPKIRKRLNDRIYDVSAPVYADTIGDGLAAIDNVLRGHSLERKPVLTVDTDFISNKTSLDHILSNENGGRVTFDLRFDEAFDVTNSMLVFSWFKMNSGRYEIVAYVS